MKYFKIASKPDLGSTILLNCTKNINVKLSLITYPEIGSANFKCIYYVPLNSN